MKTLRCSMLRCSILYNLVTILIGGLKFVKGLPSDYCLPKPNLDDCGETPTQVFTYYHPGSRCEIEMWRGCPSMNIFENEYTCSHHCIGRLWGDLDSDENESPPFVIPAKDSDEKPEAVEENECEKSINTTDCGKEPIEVYTYDTATKTCIKAEWNGCETKNKFSDEESCYKACGGDNWDEKIKKLPMEDIEEIDKILDDAIEEKETEAGEELDAVEEEEEGEQAEASGEPEDGEVPEAVLLKKETNVESEETTEHIEDAVTTSEEVTTTEAAIEEPTEVPTTTEDEVGQAEEIETT